MSSDLRVVFMGSPDFALESLNALSESFNVVGVVTQPDKPAGRGQKLTPPPVKELAEELGIPVIQPRRLREPQAMEQVKAWSPDVIVVAAFGQILHPEVLELPPFGCINVHASLLPRWRGAAPINAAILHGDTETGVTIMKMDPGLDTGPMLSKRSIPIAENETAGSLFEKLARLGAELLIDTLPDYLEGNIAPQPQDDRQQTYAPMLKKEDGLLDFNHEAGYLERKVRAFNPWPGAYFIFEEQPLKVHRAHVEKGNISRGKRDIYQGWPAVGTKKDLLVLDEVQPAGKKQMTGKAFLAGSRSWE